MERIIILSYAHFVHRKERLIPVGRRLKKKIDCPNGHHLFRAETKDKIFTLQTRKNFTDIFFPNHLRTLIHAEVLNDRFQLVVKTKHFIAYMKAQQTTLYWYRIADEANGEAELALPKDFRLSKVWPAGVRDTVCFTIASVRDRSIGRLGLCDLWTLCRTRKVEIPSHIFQYLIDDFDSDSNSFAIAENNTHFVFKTSLTGLSLCKINKATAEQTFVVTPTIPEPIAHQIYVNIVSLSCTQRLALAAIQASSGMTEVSLAVACLDIEAGGVKDFLYLDTTNVSFEQALFCTIKKSRGMLYCLLVTNQFQYQIVMQVGSKLHRVKESLKSMALIKRCLKQSIAGRDPAHLTWETNLQQLLVWTIKKHPEDGRSLEVNLRRFKLNL